MEEPVEKSMTTRQRVAARLRGAFPDGAVEVVDLTGTDDHLEARVVSSAFEGKTAVERHRMVYAPLRQWIEDDTVHALSVRARTPEPGEPRDAREGGE